MLRDEKWVWNYNLISSVESRFDRWQKGLTKIVKAKLAELNFMQVFMQSSLSKCFESFEKCVLLVSCRQVCRMYFYHYRNACRWSRAANYIKYIKVNLNRSICYNFCVLLVSRGLVCQNKPIFIFNHFFSKKILIIDLIRFMSFSQACAKLNLKF